MEATSSSSETTFDSGDFSTMVDIGYGRMRDHRTISSNIGFNGGKVVLNRGGKEKINNNIAEYLRQAGLDPKEKISDLPEDKREGRVWQIATTVRPLQILGEAGGGFGENGVKLQYKYNIGGAKGEYNHITETVTMSTKAFFKDNLYLATLIGHELMHRFDHYNGLYTNLGVTGSYIPSVARNILEVRAYQMQRWLSGGQFINKIDDEPFYNLYYNAAKHENNNYNVIIKDYTTFFNNIQR